MSEPAGASAFPQTPPMVPNQVATDAPVTVLQPWGHVVVLALSVVGLVLNIIAGGGFPSNAPVEWIMNGGFSLAIFAVVATSIAGLAYGRNHRRARPNNVFPWLGAGFAAFSFFAWFATAFGTFGTLAGLDRGRYSEDTIGAFLTGIMWGLGAIFSAFALRSGGQKHNNPLAWAGIAMWAIQLAGIVTAALLYAAGLTD